MANSKIPTSQTLGSDEDANSVALRRLVDGHRIRGEIRLVANRPRTLYGVCIELSGTRELASRLVHAVEDQQPVQRVLFEIAAIMLASLPSGVFVETLPPASALVAHDRGSKEARLCIQGAGRDGVTLRHWAHVLWNDLRGAGVIMEPLILPSGPYGAA